MDIKHSHFAVTLFVLLFYFPFFGKTNNEHQYEKELAVLREWKAGAQVSIASVKEFGMDEVFVSQPINDAIFARISGKSFSNVCTVPREELRYLKVLHYTLEGKIQLGEMICNKSISDDLLDIFRALFDVRYPIEKILLVDEYDADDETSMSANNSSCFNFRFIASSKTISKHAAGMAVDINPLYNPHVKKNADNSLTVHPYVGERYADRSKVFYYKIDKNDACYKEFIKHGFRWGGDWKSSKDYQHFEK